MVTLAYNAKVYKGPRSCTMVVEDLPILGVGRAQEEAREHTEGALREYLSGLMYGDRPFPKSHAKKQKGAVVIKIDIASLEPKAPCHQSISS